MKQHITLFTVLTLFLLVAQTLAQQNTRGGHTSAVNAVALSPDGRTFATASADGTVIVWDFATGKLLVQINGRGVSEQFEDEDVEAASFTSIAYSPDGRMLAAATGGRVILLDPKTGKVLGALETDQQTPITSLEFSPDSKILAVASASYDAAKDATTLWNVTTRAKIHTLAGSRSPIAFDLGGKLLATSGDKDWIQVWNAMSGKRLASIKKPNEFDSIRMFSFNKTGTTLAAFTNVSLKYPGGDDVLFLNPLNGKPVKTGASQRARSVARFTSDGVNFIHVGDDGLEIVNPVNGKRVSSIDNLLVFENLSSFSRNGRLLAFLSAGSGSISFIDLVSKKESEHKIGYTINATSAFFSPDSKKLIAGYDDHRLVWWDVATSKFEKIVSPLVDGKPEEDFSYIGSSALVSPDARWFMPHENAGSVYNASTGERVFKGDSERRARYTFTADGTAFVDISKETVAVRDAASGKILSRFLLSLSEEESEDEDEPDTIRAVSSYDNKIIALATEKQVSFWDPATGSKIKELPADDEYAGETFGFSPDGQFFVYTGASHDNKINVIRYISQEEVLLLEDSFPYFAISPDSKTIASISSDKHLVLTSLIDSEAEPIISEEVIRIVDYLLSEGDFGLVYSPDNKNIAVYGPYGITIFDAQTAELKGRMK